MIKIKTFFINKKEGFLSVLSVVERGGKHKNTNKFSTKEQKNVVDETCS